MVTRLDDQNVDVFLVDRGNSENVDRYDVRMLLPQFRAATSIGSAVHPGRYLPFEEKTEPEAIF